MKTPARKRRLYLKGYTWMSLRFPPFTMQIYVMHIEIVV